MHRGTLVYFAKKLAAAAFVLASLSVLSFALAELAPGDFLSELELDPQLSKETLDALRHRYGLDQGPVDRYLAWLASLARGELGYSFAHGTPVGDLVLPRVKNTLLLTVLATLLAWAIALPWGAWMAFRAGGVADRLGLLASSVLLAVPELVLGIAALVFAAETGLFPIGGMASLDHDTLGFWGRLGDLAWHLALPTLALVLASLPALLRHVRGAVAEALESPFVDAARALGVPARRLLTHYALPAAANQLISLFSVSTGGLVSGALVVEVVLSWPGLGPVFLTAIQGRDLHVVVASILLSAVFVIAGHLLADLLLFAADPRIRDPRGETP